MKTWSHPPAKQDVEHEIKIFFALLRNGDLEEAKNAVAHKFDDWDYQIWSLWQDTYLIDLEDQGEIVSDASFEGKAWLNDLGWLKRLGIEETFHWDGDGDQVNGDGEHCFINITWDNGVTDVSGDFAASKGEDGVFYIAREIIHIA